MCASREQKVCVHTPAPVGSGLVPDRKGAGMLHSECASREQKVCAHIPEQKVCAHIPEQKVCAHIPAP